MEAAMHLSDYQLFCKACLDEQDKLLRIAYNSQSILTG